MSLSDAARAKIFVVIYSRKGKTMEVRVIELTTECIDKATGLTGTVTHWIMSMDLHVEYLFQPKGLTEEGQPHDKMYLNAARLEVKDSDYEMVDVPTEILGTKVTDKASGFAGMATQFVHHTSGCFHVVVQPAGKNKKTGKRIESYDFDLRMLTGKNIPKQTKAERKEDERARPSPSSMPARKRFV